jgi:DNA-binding NarL/FixJ family response regulator
LPGHQPPSGLAAIAARALEPSPPAGDGPRVLLVDDHAPLRRQLRDLLEDAGIQVIAEAADGAEAVPAAWLADPDVIVMDVRMPPGPNGIEATRRMRATGVRAPILILTGYPDPGIAEAAHDAGANGVLLKGDPPEELATAIRQAWAGVGVRAR